MKRWRSIRRKIAKNSNRKGIYSHSIWNNFRKPGIYLMVTVILLITKVGILYTYGGEFGGFDIDIGADEGIFDNWEEAEGNQETTEPEQKENGSSNGNASNNNSNNDSANGGISSNDIENDGNNNSHNSGSSNRILPEYLCGGKQPGPLGLHGEYHHDRGPDPWFQAFLLFWEYT